MKKRSKTKRIIKWIGWVLLVQFVLINISAALYAYKATHLYPAADNPGYIEKENFLHKTWRLFSGLKIYRNAIADIPGNAYEKVKIKSIDGEQLNGWYMQTDTVARGTVILFHGLTNNKNVNIEEGNEFLYWGYNVLLVDARSHGENAGNKTSIGYYDAADTKAAFDFIQHKGEKQIILWGFSMGAVQIIKAIHDYELKPASIILEMPFASLHHFIGNRFKAIGLPAQPMAALTTFWIGVQQGFNGFSFDNVRYATSIHCPVLLECGDKDHLISREDITRIYEAIPSTNKKLVIYEGADHEFFYRRFKKKWRMEVEEFFRSFNS